MVDSGTSRYSRQDQLAAVIGSWAPQFLSAIDAAARDEKNAGLISQARSLLDELNQRRGDSDLAFPGDIESHIAATEVFLQRFESVETMEGRSVVEQARIIHGVMVKLKAMVETLPPDAETKTGRGLRSDSESLEKKYHASVGTPVMYAVMAAVLAARWMGFWKASWLIVIPVAYVAGAVAAGILSTIIKSVKDD